MTLKLFGILLFLFAIKDVHCIGNIGNIRPVKHLIENAMSQFSRVYYNPDTGNGLKVNVELNNLRESVLKISYRGLSCDCEQLTCNCCVGINLTRIDFDRRACTKFAYDPDEFHLNTSLSVNEREVYSGSLGILSSNPPPFCAFLPPFLLVNFCVRFFDVRTVDQNFHTCIDFETRLVNMPVLVLHFNCVKIGVGGISLHKPEDNASLIIETPEPEVYDEVNFEQQDAQVQSNTTSNLTPEEEDMIGQLKL